VDRRDFHYELPPDLVAQTPAAERSASRLLQLDGVSGEVRDRRFADLPALLRPGDLVVLNDTRVIPARLLGRKATGGAVEILVERVLDDRLLLAHVRASKPPRPDSEVVIEGGPRLRVARRREDLFELECLGPETVGAILDRWGQVPLPPYIRRPPGPDDGDRYQTVFARRDGAVAAPTAGLHFDVPTLAALATQGVEVCYVTLHVGAGTFLPVRADRIEDHRMHSERLEVSAEVAEAVRATRARGGRVVAVGTTVVRALETASRGAAIGPFAGETDIFIYPGYRFRSVDALLTNFHLPESTLLMLVCAFAGTGVTLAAYRHAVAARYRFFSYGDAMLVTRAHRHALASEPDGGG